jgi:hypothetical protein
MGVIIILIPLLIYLIAALAVKKDVIHHPDDYFAAFKKVGRTEFTSSSIAYGFQVSSIYPFLLWGASLFLFVPFINAIFWGIGILLFYFSFPKISRFLGTGKTLPGLIGDYYGNTARMVAAILTVVGFIGYIISELWFGSRVLLAVFPSKIWIYVSAIVFIIFIAIYLFRAGQVSSIRTDQLQLLFTYFGVFGIIVYMIYLIYSKGSFIDGPLTCGLIINAALIPVILGLRKAKFININSTVNRILNVIITLFFVAIFVLAVLVLINNEKGFALEGFFNLEGFGYSGLIALMLLPMGWQFIDLTSWQRLLAVKDTQGTGTINKDIKNGLLNFTIESPFTWILFIVFGVMLTAAFPDMNFKQVLVDFPKQLIQSSSILNQVLGYTFIVSIISIMLSTIDSFIMGISFTFTYDINKRSRIMIEKGTIDKPTTDSVLKNGKYFGFIAVLVAIGLFIFFDQNVKGGGQMFINLLLTFYSASLAFLPLVIGFVFLKKRPNAKWANASMLIGAILALGIGVYSVLAEPTLAWYPVIIALILSSIIYTIGYYKIKNYVR